MRAAWLLILPLLALPLLEAGALAPGGTHRVVVQGWNELSPAQRLALAAHGAATFLTILPAAVGDVTPSDLAWLRAQPWVERVDPDQPLERHLDLSTRLIRAGQPVLELGYNGTGVAIAVLDSGLDASHPDFAGRVLADVAYVNGNWQPTLVDTDGHGTHVAGIAAGSGAASNGVLRGVAPGAGLVGMDFSRAFTTTTALQAFDWVLVNAPRYNLRVVTNSWGRADVQTPWDPGDSLVRASNRLVQQGIVVVFSAGNHGPGPSSISLEAQNPNVITVGAVDDAAALAGFSGRGPVLDRDGRAMPWVKPDLVADGVGIRSTRSSQASGVIMEPTLLPSQLPGVGQGASATALRYTELSGTSQAAPHVSGIAALMLEANPNLTPAQVHDLLRDSAIDLGAAGPNDDTGFGLVDARDAVLRALGLRADRGNALLAGGEETYEAAGSLASATGQLVQTSPALQVHSSGAVEATLPIKPGATAARFDFAWTPVSAAFRVYLIGPGKTLGPWGSSQVHGTERVISGRVENPDPGVYRLVARPVAPLDAAYRTTMTVTLREQSHLPAQLEERYKAPGQGGPTDQLQDELQYELDRVGSEWHRAVPGVEAPLLAAAAAGALLLARKPHRPGRGGG